MWEREPSRLMPGGFLLHVHSVSQLSGRGLHRHARGGSALAATSSNTDAPTRWTRDVSLGIRPKMGAPPFRKTGVEMAISGRFRIQLDHPSFEDWGGHLTPSPPGKRVPIGRWRGSTVVRGSRQLT